MNTFRLRALGCAVAVGLAAMVATVTTTSAHASTGVHVSAPTLVSVPDPLPAYPDPSACGTAKGTPGSDRHGWESETTLAVDPNSADQVVAGWIQDWSDALVTAHSSDGGKAWGEAVPPSSICTPGGSSTYDGGASEPWLAFDSAGTAYLSGLEGSKDGTKPAVFVDTSSDHGRTWSQSFLTTDAFPNYLDGSQVVTDPTASGHAYVVWRVGDLVTSTRLQYFSTTSDSGRHWTAPQLLPGPSMILAGRLVAAPDGSLVDVSLAMVPQPGAGLAVCETGPGELYVTRSTNGGQVWTPAEPIVIGDVRYLSTPTVAVSPDGTVDVAWQQGDPTGGSASIHFSSWSPSSAVWSTPTAVAPAIGQPEYGGDSGPQLYGLVGAPSPFPNCPVILAAPGLAVDQAGTVAILYYDNSADPNGSPPHLTNLMLDTSTDHGATWTPSLVAGPFDHTTAPSTSGEVSGGIGFLGDYQTLVAVPHGFVAGYSLAQQLPGANFHLGDPDRTAMRTDIFASRIHIDEPS